MADLKLIESAQGAWQYEDGDACVTVRMKNGDEPTYQAVCWALMMAFASLLNQAVEEE